MALTFTEMEATTHAYFADPKATDIYFNTSFLLDRWMNQKKGIFLRPDGGLNIKVGLKYDGAEGGFYSRNSTLSSQDRVNLNAAYFGWKHAYSNATIFRTDELTNSGASADIDIIADKLETAQSTLTKILAEQIYANVADGAEEITGLGALCLAGTSTAYGGITPTDLVAQDTSTPWASVNNVVAAGVSLAQIRTLATSAKVNDGAKGKPNIGVMPEALFNQISAILQTQQRFTSDSDSVNAGFTNLVFEGKILAADDYCPATYMFLLNEQYVGFAIHQKGFFARTLWGDLLTTGTAAKSLKIFWDGNLVCSRRKAHACQTGLT